MPHTPAFLALFAALTVAPFASAQSIVGTSAADSGAAAAGREPAANDRQPGPVRRAPADDARPLRCHRPVAAVVAGPAALGRRDAPPPHHQRHPRHGIHGTVDVYNNQTGETTYGVQGGYDACWTDPSGNVVGTQGYDNPDPLRYEQGTDLDDRYDQGDWQPAALGRAFCHSCRCRNPSLRTPPL